jgi:predicted RNase H-like HicB family nuclease
MEYVVILEQGSSSFGAYVPDLPGCVAVGETKDEAMELIRAAIELHIESLRDAPPAPDEITEAINRAVDEIGDQADQFVAAAARRVLEKTER